MTRTGGGRLEHFGDLPETHQIPAVSKGWFPNAQGASVALGGSGVYKLKTDGRTARAKLEDWERAKRNPQVQERLSKLQVLLLDEVSMVSSDFLDRASQLAPRCSSAIISLA